MDELEQWEAAARRTIGMICSGLEQIGLRWVELQGPGMIGLGLAVGWPDDRFNVISVGLGGSEDTVNISAGILRDVAQDRVRILDACNRLTRDNATFPCFLHDAEAGWDVLTSLRLPVGVFASNIAFLNLYLESQALVCENLRSDPDLASLGGAAYTWDEADVNRLLTRSLL
jgi:hypothetical protein